jgi:hypothetical protein
MMRVISSPSSLTTGVFTLIFAITRPHLPNREAAGCPSFGMRPDIRIRAAPQQVCSAVGHPLTSSQGGAALRRGEDPVSAGTRLCLRLGAPNWPMLEHHCGALAARDKG